MRSIKLMAMAVAAIGCQLAQAQTGTPPPITLYGVTVYGIFDEYLGYTNASSHEMKTLDSGGLMASRLGFRGKVDLGNSGLKATYTLEHGLSADTGASADTTRVFNRQAWAGLQSDQYGEIRFGRQNSPQFTMSANFDAFGHATYGSLMNNTTAYVPRFDNMIHYLAPEFAGVKLQIGTSLGEQASPHTTGLTAYLFAAEYRNGPAYLGMNHVRQKSANGAFTTRATYFGGNYDYGSGKIYAAYFSGNTPGSVPASNEAGREYGVWSLSADYRVLPTLSVGALYGSANDKSTANKDATQVSFIGKYDISDRMEFYAVLARLENKNTANFSLGAAGPITRNTPPAGGDVGGAQVGMRFMF